MRELKPEEIDERKDVAGRFGLILGCIAAVLALGIELFIAPKPLTGLSVLTASLMAALNVPLGIALGLLGERLSRRPVDEP